MKPELIYKKALDLKFISRDEATFLYKFADTSELIFISNEIRKKLHPDSSVSWIIDRNINITNVCISNCRFCNFHCKPNSVKSYITSIDQYKIKIKELLDLGGNQILLQGGLHPKLGLDFYTDLFSELKKLFPDIKLHALGPPEVHHLSKLSKKTYKEVLISLINSGLDSLPGAGAEILSDRVRKTISPGKCTSKQWLDVMRAAHNLGLSTSATMMFGHIETIEERIDHLFLLRELKNECSKNYPGFVSFTPWPFQSENTALNQDYDIKRTTANDYIRLIALSRIVLLNIKNIQASWLTVGFETAKICLHAGANDFGSIMIEENVVSSAGAKYSTSKEKMKNEILSAGFIPHLRNQKYEYLD
ncbi:MAG: cyclic dehypoxanthinyl futalosine synthase [Bacteroidota bacterium]